MEIDITQEQLDLWENGMLIQKVAPHLSANEREFIISGVTPDEWADMFKLEEDMYCDPVDDWVDRDFSEL